MRENATRRAQLAYLRDVAGPPGPVPEQGPPVRFRALGNDQGAVCPVYAESVNSVANYSERRKGPVRLACPRDRQCVGPHRLRVEKQGAETSRPRARKPLATVRCREPVNGVRPPRGIQPPEQVGPQPVGRVETRDRKSARTFSSRGRQTGIREKSPCSCISCSESARRWRAGLGDPPDTNSPQGRPPRAKAGTTPPRMWTQPRLSSTTRCLPPARRERTVLTRAQCRAFHGGWSWPTSGRRGAGP